jgi:hypothetical protein
MYRIIHKSVKHFKNSQQINYVRFEVFTAVTVKNAVLWYIRPSSYLTGNYVSATELSRLMLCKISGSQCETVNNALFSGITPCGSCKNRRFGGTYRLQQQGNKNQ